MFLIKLKTILFGQNSMKIMIVDEYVSKFIKRIA